MLHLLPLTLLNTGKLAWLRRKGLQIGMAKTKGANFGFLINLAIVASFHSGNLNGRNCFSLAFMHCSYHMIFFVIKAPQAPGYVAVGGYRPVVRAMPTCDCNGGYSVKYCVNWIYHCWYLPLVQTTKPPRPRPTRPPHQTTTTHPPGSGSIATHLAAECLRTLDKVWWQARCLNVTLLFLI